MRVKKRDWDIPVHTSCPFLNSKEKIILMDQTILELIFLLESAMSDEFLIYADLEENDRYYILRNPLIPRQKVTAYSVTVEDSHIDKKAVIHRHPPGVNSFSSTDYEYINKNNTISILYVDGEFPEATLLKRMPCGEYLMKTFKPTIYIIYNEDATEKARAIFEEQRANIRKEVPKKTSYRYYGGPYYGPRIVFVDDEEEDESDCDKRFKKCLETDIDINDCYSIYYQCLD